MTLATFQGEIHASVIAISSQCRLWSSRRL